MNRVVDLRSDTVTRPTPAMRRAMAEAEVGDDVLGDDPTVQALEAEAARRLGHEAALLLPSGTMANQVAVALHVRPGDEVIAEASSHVYNFEGGAVAALSGAQVQPVPGRRGVLDPAEVARRIRPDNPHFPRTRLLCVENTANAGGGTVQPPEVVAALLVVARENGLRTHLDGARLFNAAVALGRPAAQLAAGFDTVSFCLSKGLGAPAGSVLCGSREAIAEARRIRKRFGGAMRQAGILAAAGLHALQHHVGRLADDHRRARRLYEGLAERGLDAEPPETNMVWVTLPEPTEAVARWRDRGVLAVAIGGRVRLVTHLDVDDEAIETAIEVIAGCP